jgi:lipopolysaccharide transport system permease protein
VANPNFVRKVVFPLEILPWVMSVTAIAHLLIAIVLWVAGYWLLVGAPNASLIYIPLLLLVFLPLLLSIGWALAAIGVFVRDVDQVTGMVARAMLFMTPIFYRSEDAPEIIQCAMRGNPLAFIVEQFQRVLYVGQAPDMPGLLIWFLFTSCTSAAALYVFHRVRPTFSDYV